MEHTEIPAVTQVRLDVQIALPMGLSEHHKAFIMQRLWSELLYMDEGFSEVEVVAENYLQVKLHIDEAEKSIFPFDMARRVNEIVKATLEPQVEAEVAEFIESMQEDKEDHHG